MKEYFLELETRFRRQIFVVQLLLDHPSIYIHEAVHIKNFSKSSKLQQLQKFGHRFPPTEDILLFSFDRKIASHKNYRNLGKVFFSIFFNFDLV